MHWSLTVCRRGESMPSGPSFVVCKTMNDFLVLSVLQAIVKEEDSRFLFRRLRQEIAEIQELNKRFRLPHSNDTEAEVAHRQRRDRYVRRIPKRQVSRAFALLLMPNFA